MSGADWPFVPASGPISTLADVLREEVPTAEDGVMTWRDSCALALVIESKLAARGLRVVESVEINVSMAGLVVGDIPVSPYPRGRAL